MWLFLQNCVQPKRCSLVSSQNLRDPARPFSSTTLQTQLISDLHFPTFLHGFRRPQSRLMFPPVELLQVNYRFQFQICSFVFLPSHSQGNHFPSAKPCRSSAPSTPLFNLSLPRPCLLGVTRHTPLLPEQIFLAGMQNSRFGRLTWVTTHFFSTAA